MPQPTACANPSDVSARWASDAGSGRPFACIDCAHSRPARYDERTSGPASTPRNQISSASALISTNSSGRTQRATGK